MCVPYGPTSQHKPSPVKEFKGLRFKPGSSHVPRVSINSLPAAHTEFIRELPAMGSEVDLDTLLHDLHSI